MGKTLNITLLPGDGIGPEVVAQAVKVLEALEERYEHKFNYHTALIGASAIEKTGDPCPDETMEVCKSTDAILMGAIGEPRYVNDPNAPIRPEHGMLRLRKELGLYANIRPIKMYDRLAGLSVIREEVLKDVDFVIFRELTGGIYFGSKAKGDDYASDECIY